MPDMPTLSAILTSVKTATEIAKYIKSADVTLEKAEIKLKLAELVSALADIKIELATVQEILIEKDKKIRDLEESFNLKKKIKYESPCYWVIGDDGKTGPYCQQCYDSNKKLIRLQDTHVGGWICNTCKNHFDKRG